MINCKDCFYWDRHDTKDAYLNLAGVHVCLRVKEFFDATQWAPSEQPDDNGLELRPKFKEGLAFVNDGSSYKAELVTFGDFGCVYGTKVLSTGKDPD